MVYDHTTSAMHYVNTPFSPPLRGEQRTKRPNVRGVFFTSKNSAPSWKGCAVNSHTTPAMHNISTPAPPPLPALPFLSLLLVSVSLRHFILFTPFSPFPLFCLRLPLRCQVGVALSADSVFQQVSYVNAICTIKGGTHVECVANQVIAKLLPVLKRKHKAEVRCFCVFVFHAFSSFFASACLVI